ncbi:response regulator [Sporolactobacillus spathodeae]|uniref:Two-component system chemotaxis response regulator CheY n=1 Tax=Sporolactobacillus spathodeae TaxID=1465502 RepID=A0ABS2Q5P4_9BACL|nr:response regulator [Sporolactobacillus spathodeae]MBM7657109.1 two-component system chemotaxis response regulator CheY [Sporolactobacillus spathodeae]
MFKSVLIVDDSRFMRQYIKNMLDPTKFAVVGEASNGLEAFNQYIALNPDLVIMDITMPILNGIDGLKKIIDYDPRANVVICSSLGSKHLVIKALKLGAKEFVLKPFFNDMSSRLENIIK